MEADQVRSRSTELYGQKLVSWLLLQAEQSGISVAVNRLIWQADHSEDALGELAKALLADACIAHRVVRLANSAYFHRTGSRVSSLPKAITLLGVDQVRTLALSATLLDHLNDHKQAVRLRQEFARSFYASMLARELAGVHRRCNREDAALGALMRGCGRLLLALYAFDSFSDVQRYALTNDQTESVAAQQLLGLTFETLSVQILQSWSLPRPIVMAAAACPEILRVKADPERYLQMLSELANELAFCLSINEAPVRLQRTQQRLMRFETALDLSASHLAQRLQACDEQVQTVSQVLGVSQPLQAGQWLIDQLETGQTQPVPELCATGNWTSATRVVQALRTGTRDAAILRASEAAPGEVLRAVAHAVFQALSPQRVLIGLLDADSGLMGARYLEGRPLLGKLHEFRFAPCGAEDLFSQAFSRGIDVHIRDALSGQLPRWLPAWYRACCFDARSFMLLPLMEESSAAGFIYLDRNHVDNLRLSEEEIGLLRMLKTEAALVLSASRREPPTESLTRSEIETHPRVA